MTIKQTVLDKLHQYCQDHHYTQAIHLVNNTNHFDVAQVQNWLNGVHLPADQSIYQLASDSQLPLSWWLNVNPSAHQLNYTQLDYDIGAELIKQFKTEHHYTINQMAVRFGIGYTRLSMYLNPYNHECRNLSLNSLIKVADYLNCSVDDLCYPPLD